MLNNIKMDSQNHLLGNLCHLQHNNIIVMDDALNRSGVIQLNYKDFVTMTKCCLRRTISCTHAEEEENVRCLIILKVTSPASKNSFVMEDQKEKCSILLFQLLGHPHFPSQCLEVLVKGHKNPQEQMLKERSKSNF